MIIITKSYRSFLRILTTLLLLTLFSISAFAQSGEQIIILWDVTGSLLPNNKGEKDLDGTTLPTYAGGNGMWKDLKHAIIECIQYAEEDPGNEITIITFNDAIRDIYPQRATADGKKALVEYVTKYKYKNHQFTNIVDPVKRFYSLLKKDKINYMFLFTDGDNDHPSTKNQLIPTLSSWASKTTGQNAYGFYVLVHPNANKPEIRNTVDSQNNFWIVKDSKIRIKICSFPASIKYNLRDEKGPKTIIIRGKFVNAGGNVRLIADDEYYDIICSDLAIDNGKINIEVKPKGGINPPVSHTIILKPQLTEADPYTFVGPQEINLIVSNLPERSLNLTIADKNLGKASYYGSFLMCKESLEPVTTDIIVEFSEQAKIEKSSAVMKVYLVDKKSEEMVSPSSQKLSISINGKGDSLILTPDISHVKLTISGQPDTKSGSYYGRIELIPTNLDNCSVNDELNIFKWKMSFAQKWNPLKKVLTWLFGILVSAFLIWMFFLKPIFHPKFGSIQKNFIIPGMAPLIVRFKGARMVVVAASHQKKQSAWNRFWTGKILYVTHPAFVSPIIFRPRKGRRILARVQPGTYQIMPNPMPGVGAATIIDIQKNLKINVN